MLKAAITTLLLGTSTVALADTPYPDTYRDDYRGEYRRETYQPQYDARYEQNYDNHFVGRDYRRHRIVLAQNAVLGSAQGSLWVPIDARIDLSRIRLRLDSGRTIVRSVTLVYADGHRETMDVNRALTTDQPTLTVDLTHSGVRGILVDTQQQRRYARGAGWRRTSTATVDVIGLRR